MRVATINFRGSEEEISEFQLRGACQGVGFSDDEIEQLLSTEKWALAGRIILEYYEALADAGLSNGDIVFIALQTSPLMKVERIHNIMLGRDIQFPIHRDTTRWDAVAAYLLYLRQTQSSHHQISSAYKLPGATPLYTSTQQPADGGDTPYNAFAPDR
jgi:hypothetical protein